LCGRRSIVAESTVVVLAAKQATATIPIVFPIAGDPVGTELVASLARPGGNVTGLSIQATDLAPKRLELFREIVPGLTRLAIMANVGSPNALLEAGEVQATVRTFGLEATAIEVRRAEDIAPAFEAPVPRTSELSEIREQMKACHQALIELETRAGITKAAEKLRTEPANYIGIYDAAEPHSDEQRELVAAEETFHQQRTTRRLRDLYFMVRNSELRKELIVKDREEGSLALRYWQEELANAAAKLETARSTHKRWWVWASIWGIVLLGLGFHFFGLIGALGGLLVGCLNGRRMEQEALRGRDSAIADAERDLKDAEETWNEVRNQPQTFSQREAKTGNPDPESRLRAV
jgi:hypothetical protein